MPNYDLGTATGRIKIDYDGKGVNQAQQGLSQVEKGSDKTSSAVGKVGTVTGVAGLAIAAGIGLAVKSAATFEQRLSAIQAVSGNTAGEMEKVRAKALQIGKDTAFSATEAAQAMEELSKSGLSTSDILNGAADATVALAAAGEVSLPEAATIASNAMNQFGLSAAQMPKVADAIAGAANASAIDVSEFGQSLSQVGAVAHLAGLSFHDTSVAIAEMGNAGIKGSDAGTSLKTMLSNLQPSTKRQTTAMKELGLITEDGTNRFYDQQGRLKGLRDIQEILGNSLKGLTQAQKQVALQTIFGSDAIRASAVLAGQGAAGFDKMAGAIDKVKAADVAKTRLDNFNGSLEQLKGSLETAAITAGQIFLPILRKVVDFFTSVLNVFLALPGPLQSLVVVFVAVAGAALLMLAAVIKIYQAFKIAQEVVVALRIAMTALNLTFLANPIFLVIAAIIALVAIFIYAYRNSETFRDIVNGAFNAVKNVVMAVVTWITGTAVPAIVNAFNAAKNGIVAAWNAVVAFITGVFNIILTIITTYINLWRTIIITGVNAILAVWRAYWGLFGPFLTAVFNLIVAIITLALKLAMLPIGLFLRGVQAAWTTTWNALSTITRVVTNAILSVVRAVFGALAGPVNTAMNAIRNVIVTAWNAVRSFTSSALNSIRSIISSVFSAIRVITSIAWSAFRAIIANHILSALSLIGSVMGRIRGVFAGAGSLLWNAGRAIIQGLLNGITSLINTVTSKLQWLTNLIPSWKGPADKDEKLLVKNGQLIMKGLIVGIDDQIEPLRKTLAGITTDIPGMAVGSTTGSATQATVVPSLPVQNPARVVNYNTVVNNPLPEPAGTSINKRLQTVQLLGA